MALSASSLPFAIKHVVAPMVGQSDLAFRLLCRRHGADIAYTEMFFSDRFATDGVYRKTVLQTCSEDRPLVVQFCGNDPGLMQKAAKLAESSCDAIDINLGCPQQRAMDSLFGSYLLDRKHWSTVYQMVSCVSQEVTVPVFCKIRLLQNLSQTLEFCLGLQAAGCALLAVHGRTRGSPRQRREGPADLEAIRSIKSTLSIPVVSNGNVREFDDISANLATTCADGIMSAEGILADPLLFQGGATCRDDRLLVALEYLALAEEWRSSPESMQLHIAYMLGRRGTGSMVSYDYYGEFRRAVDLKRAISAADTACKLASVVKKSLGMPNCGQSSPFAKP